MPTSDTDFIRTHLEINARALTENLEAVRCRVGKNVAVLAVIKADAYGHGAVEIARLLQNRADCFGVATPGEAFELRAAGIETPILILGYTAPSQYDAVIQSHVMPTIYREEDAFALSEAAVRLSMSCSIHIALDTGMGRIGFFPNETSADIIVRIAALPGIMIDGLFTHFACADEVDKSFTNMQLSLFDSFCHMLESRGIQIPVKHVCNSAGIIDLDDHRFNMVRAGIILYGLYPSNEVIRQNLPIRPVLSWKTKVIHLKRVPAGTPISYGAAYRTTRESLIATLPTGYADGYPRSISGKGRVLIHGCYAPITGRVCMDQMMVNVTDIPGVEMGSEAILLGRSGGNEITIEELASLSGRFYYEIPCLITPRVPRIIV